MHYVRCWTDWGLLLPLAPGLCSEQLGVMQEAGTRIMLGVLISWGSVSDEESIQALLLSFLFFLFLFFLFYFSVIAKEEGHL